MLNKLKPKLYVDSIYHINFEKLKQKGISGIIIDLDNTITEWDNPRLPDTAFDWFTKMQHAGLKACIASNNSQDRVVKAVEKLGIPYVAKANKPRRGAFRKAMEMMKTKPEQTAVVGDQIFTDILGGNRLNLFTILVVPINTKEFIGTKLVRIVERRVLKSLITKKD
ncbi:YqeG family HAD IIIA-type phosphatase [Desulfitibacter alkalitolerans]|uniref:YqeG family HAD IIIA-type phosphatase n=1 Tax=Desulfitibacter alkalitolerans TaxID=264641 RepID=UPI000488B9D5|nr:YqeG family HAD IIIA-type phosphatase [Desulfitibacter alkalitolerans]